MRSKINTAASASYATATHRLWVADFDSVEQARIWLTFGPEVALERFITMLRLARVFSHHIYVDRNQLFDGICFLALGPAGVRNALGLEAFEELPFVIGGRGEVTEESDSSRQSWVLQQLTDVQNPAFISSASFALEKYQKPAPPSALGLAAEPAVSHPLANILPPLFGITRQTGQERKLPVQVSRRRILNPKLVQIARKEWEAELLDSSLPLTQWPRMIKSSAPGFWKPMPADSLPGEIAKNIAQLLQNWCLAQEADANTLITRSAVAKQLSHWVENKTGAFAELSLQKRIFHANSALRWWSYLYHEALIDDNSGNAESPKRARLAFWDTNPVISIAPFNDLTLIEQQWGLRIAALRGITLLWARIFASRQSGQNVRVEGELLESVKEMDPVVFRQFIQHPLVKQITDNPGVNPAAGHDAVLAARELTPDDTPWAKRIKLTAFRFLLLLLAAVLLTMFEFDVLQFPTPVALVFWPAIAFIAAFPFSEAAELMKITTAHMTSTIRVSGGN